MVPQQTIQPRLPNRRLHQRETGPLSNIPNWWQFALLAGAAFRTWRLLAADAILDKPREWLTRRAKAEAGKHREEVDIFLHCPWCLGFWVTLAWWGAWLIWPHATVLLAVPWAANALVGLVAQNLDGD
jgi:uncharacterized protein DUF1360